jgi:hypothetical protein
MRIIMNNEMEERFFGCVIVLRVETPEHGCNDGEDGRLPVNTRASDLSNANHCTVTTATTGYCLNPEGSVTSWWPWGRQISIDGILDFV